MSERGGAGSGRGAGARRLVLRFWLVGRARAARAWCEVGARGDDGRRLAVERIELPRFGHLHDAAAALLHADAARVLRAGAVVGEVEVRDEGELVAKGQRAGEHDRVRPHVRIRVDRRGEGGGQLRRARPHRGLDLLPLGHELLPRARDGGGKVAAREQRVELVVGPQERHVQLVGRREERDVRRERRRVARGHLLQQSQRELRLLVGLVERVGDGLAELGGAELRRRQVQRARHREQRLARRHARIARNQARAKPGELRAPRRAGRDAAAVEPGMQSVDTAIRRAQAGGRSAKSRRRDEHRA